MKRKPKTTKQQIAALEDHIAEMMTDWDNLGLEIEEAQERLKRMKDERLWSYALKE
jgi:regulator of replication initiation timing